MKDRLATGGIAAAWVPANGIRSEDLKTLLRGFHEVYPHMSVWYMNTLPTDFLIVVGTPERLDIDVNRLAERTRPSEIAHDLALVGLADPLRLVYTLLSAEERVDAYLGAGPVNTDDRPVLSYSTYGAGFRSTISANLVELMASRDDPGRYIRQGPDSVTMLRHQATTTEVLLGHVAHLSGDENKALGHYVRAAQLLPQDPSLLGLAAAAYLTNANH
jgi:spermidine synthase